jgi:type IV secretory pathway TrbF-like protein
LDIGISPSSATVESPSIESPSAIYEAGRREWNERYGSYISRARQWRLMAMVLAGTTAVSTCCAVWMAGQAHVVPYVVEVNKLGESLAVHRVVAAPPIDPGRIRSQLARWVADVRTVYADPDAVRANGTEALAWVEHGSDAFAQVTALFRDNSPVVRGARESVGVVLESVGQIGADTWSVDWTEEARPKDGMVASVSSWRLTARIAIVPPTDDATIMVNPGGVYLTWFKITPRAGR